MAEKQAIPGEWINLNDPTQDSKNVLKIDAHFHPLPAPVLARIALTRAQVLKDEFAKFQAATPEEALFIKHLTERVDLAAAQLTKGVELTSDESVGTIRIKLGTKPAPISEPTKDAPVHYESDIHLLEHFLGNRLDGSYPSNNPNIFYYNICVENLNDADRQNILDALKHQKINGAEIYTSRSDKKPYLRFEPFGQDNNGSWSALSRKMVQLELAKPLGNIFTNDVNGTEKGLGLLGDVQLGVRQNGVA